MTAHTQEAIGPGRSARARSQSGWTLVELLAALAILGLGLAMSFELLYRGASLDHRAHLANLRTLAAERLMERVVAGPYSRLQSRELDLDADLSGGESGWTATIEVTENESGTVKEIAVTVTGGDRSTTLRTRRARAAS